MTILDIIIILVLLYGAFEGFKKGAIKSLVTLVGTILVVVVAYYLKNPVAGILFDFVPFLNFGGSFKGLITLNILLYESIAYVLVFVILWTILSVFIKLSSVIEKVLNATIILGIPSKIIGAILGLLEALVFSFLVLFVMIQINTTHEFVSKSKFATTILDKTPLIGTMIDDTYKAIMEIRDLKDKYTENKDLDAYNGEILNIMLNYKVITPEMTEKLIEDEKLKFNGAQNILNNYKEGLND